MCDSCFNYMRTRCGIFEGKKHAAFLQLTRRVFGKQLPDTVSPAPPPRGLDTPPPVPSRAADKAQVNRLLAGTSASEPESAAAAAAAAPAHQKMAQTRNQLAEATDKLIERGEKLDELGTRVNEMSKNAASFADCAKRLKQKQKKSWWP